MLRRIWMDPIATLCLITLNKITDSTDLNESKGRFICTAPYCNTTGCDVADLAWEIQTAEIIREIKKNHVQLNRKYSNINWRKMAKCQKPQLDPVSAWMCLFYLWEVLYLWWAVIRRMPSKYREILWLLTCLCELICSVPAHTITPSSASGIREGWGCSAYWAVI